MRVPQHCCNDHPLLHMAGRPKCAPFSASVAAAWCTAPLCRSCCTSQANSLVFGCVLDSTMTCRTGSSCPRQASRLYSPLGLPPAASQRSHVLGCRIGDKRDQLYLYLVASAFLCCLGLQVAMCQPRWSCISAGAALLREAAAPSPSQPPSSSPHLQHSRTCHLRQIALLLLPPQQALRWRLQVLPAAVAL